MIGARSRGLVLNKLKVNIMKTRQDYLNKKCTHREYYSQFVQPWIKKVVLQRFSKDLLKRCIKEDKHLNNLDLKHWDSMEIGFLRNNSDIRNICRNLKDQYSISTGVCILKEAARQITEE